MLPNRQRVVEYERALEILRKPETARRSVWLHDYDQECYRTRDGYTRNGLHWGYPDDIVGGITDPTLLYTYAVFVTPQNARKTLYTQGSRYQKVAYSEIKDSIELSVEQNLKEARKLAKKEDAALARWSEKIKKKHPRFTSYALRLDVTKSGAISFLVPQPDRFLTRGFGTFLERIKKGEVSISPKAKEALAGLTARSGLVAAEFFQGPIVAGTFNLQDYVIPVNMISVQPGALQGLFKLARIEE